MTRIHVAPFPGDAARVFLAPLRHLPPEPGQAAAPRRRLVLHGPLPVHALHPATAGQLARGLTRAGQVGWRALVCQATAAQAEAVAVADIADIGNHHALLRGAEPAAALRAALAAAAGQLAAWQPRGLLTLRILEIPPLFTTALWLAGRRPLFFPTRIDAVRCPPGRVFNRAGLLAALADAVSHRLAPPSPIIRRRSP